MCLIYVIQIKGIKRRPAFSLDDSENCPPWTQLPLSFLIFPWFLLFLPTVTVKGCEAIECNKPIMRELFCEMWKLSLLKAPWAQGPCSFTVPSTEPGTWEVPQKCFWRNWMTQLHLTPFLPPDGASCWWICLHLSYSIMKVNNSSGEYCESATGEEIGNFKGGANPEALEQKRHMFSAMKGRYDLNLWRE